MKKYTGLAIFISILMITAAYAWTPGGTWDEFKLAVTDLVYSIIPHTNNAIDLGSSSKEFKDLYIDGTAYIDTISGGAGVTEADTLDSVSDRGATTNQAITTGGVTVTTGNNVTVGTTQWDNGSDKIDGEQIADNTIDEDSIDFGTGTDQVSASDLPNEDVGQVSISSGTYTVEDFTLNTTADANNNRIVNLTNPVNPLDAVNLDTLFDHIGLLYTSYLRGSNLLSTTLLESETADTEVLNATPVDTLSAIYYKSTVADTPTPFVIMAGSLINFHFDAKVGASGQKPTTIQMRLFYMDSGGSSGKTGIAPISDATAELTDTKTSYQIHSHVATEITVPAGKRLWVEVYANTTGGQAYPTVSIYRDAGVHHISFGVAGGILANFVRIDATTPLTADWDIGNYDITLKALTGDGAGTFASLDVIEGNIANVGDVALDSLTADNGTGPIIVNDEMEFQDGEKLLLGTGSDGEIYSSSDDLYIENNTSDKDIIFRVNDGGTPDTAVMTIDASVPSVIIAGTSEIGFTDATAKFSGASTSMEFETPLIIWDGTVGDLKMVTYQNDTLADNGEVNLPDVTSGFGQGSCGDEHFLFSVEADGSVQMTGGTTNTAATESDSNFCIYDGGGTTAVIKNMLGSAKETRFVYWYN